MSKRIDLTYGATASGETISSVITVTTGGLLINIDEAIPASSTDLALAIAFDHSKLKAYAIRATTAMTLEFNSSSAGAPTFSLAANQGTNWHTGDPHASLFSADVTGLYVTSTAAGTLRAMFLIDPT